MRACARARQWSAYKLQKYRSNKCQWPNFNNFAIDMGKVNFYFSYSSLLWCPWSPLSLIPYFRQQKKKNQRGFSWRRKNHAQHVYTCSNVCVVAANEKFTIDAKVDCRKSLNLWTFYLTIFLFFRFSYWKFIPDEMGITFLRICRKGMLVFFFFFSIFPCHFLGKCDSERNHSSLSLSVHWAKPVYISTCLCHRLFHCFGDYLWSLSCRISKLFVVQIKWNGGERVTVERILIFSRKFHLIGLSQKKQIDAFSSPWWNYKALIHEIVDRMLMLSTVLR